MGIKDLNQTLRGNDKKKVFVRKLIWRYPYQDSKVMRWELI